MEFDKAWLQESVGDKDSTVLDEIIGHRRWSVDHRRVFRHDGKFYETHYSRGATECQEERPYENEDEKIKCAEVFAVEKTVVVYQ